MKLLVYRNFTLRKEFIREKKKIMIQSGFNEESINEEGSIEI